MMSGQTPSESAKGNGVWRPSKIQVSSARDTDKASQMSATGMFQSDWSVLAVLTLGSSGEMGLRPPNRPLARADSNPALVLS
jgi:hypothetical protein